MAVTPPAAALIVHTDARVRRALAGQLAELGLSVEEAVPSARLAVGPRVLLFVEASAASTLRVPRSARMVRLVSRAHPAAHERDVLPLPCTTDRLEQIVNAEG